jgi:hypothetical protein
MNDVAGRPRMSRGEPIGRSRTVVAEHPAAGRYHLYADRAEDLLFTENETNRERLGAGDNASPYTKDAFHRYLIEGDTAAVNPAATGTKAAAIYRLEVPAGGSASVRLRLTADPRARPFARFDDTLGKRRAEADEFYDTVHRDGLSPGEKHVQRQAIAGMIWSKQLYYYDIEQWLRGDPAMPVPPAERLRGRNNDWAHLNNFDILSMPDTWEYPWYAAWDLAFHCVPLAMVDPAFAKRQLSLITREWYMHPNGQLPAYEWHFGDANPPVHAWAARRIFEMGAAGGTRDLTWLEGVFHKLLLNFTWWVNRKDADGNNVFQGGFLGLDNISVFDRSATFPGGGRIDQSDATAWMAFYTLEMLRIALLLAVERPVYQDIATKFYEHFLSIANALVTPGHCLWDPDDEFFYDILRLPDGEVIPLRVRSVVGLIPLLAVEVIDGSVLKELPDFARRMRWFTDNRPHLSGNMASAFVPGVGNRHLLSVITPDRLRGVLRYLLDPAEFLSEHGIRSLSRVHRDHPYQLEVPINYLLIEALREYAAYYGDDFTVEFPIGSGRKSGLSDIADGLAERLVGLFLPGADGRRPLFRGEERFATDPWKELLHFPEYFHGDTGQGLGASHQTGWTGLVADLIQRREPRG